MEQFAIIAAAHFLALLIPGVDFFLIVRTAISRGRRSAVAVCLGIAAANAAVIAAAFTGMTLLSDPSALAFTQVVGGLFLLVVGVNILRHSNTVDVETGIARDTGARPWIRYLGLGATSAVLNPKNVLFYVSLAAVVAAADPGAKVFYGVWMTSVVLVWDTLVALVMTSRLARQRLALLLPWVSRIAGAFLIFFGAGMIAGWAMT